MKNKETVANPIEKARALLIEEEQKARNAFATEISDVCKKHGFELKVSAEIVAVKS